MRPRVLLLLGALAGLSCYAIFYWNMEVSWSIDDSVSKAQCSAYGIAAWEVEARGPEPRTLSYRTDCGSAWSTGAAFFDIEEGHYNVTVRALNASDKVLASRTKEGVPLFQDREGGNRVNINLTSADFAGTPGDTKLNVYWSINGTQDGTDTGPSWDACSEVGAATARVKVTGRNAGFAKTYDQDCHSGGAMAIIVSVPEDTYDVEVTLLDGSKGELTTTAKGTVSATQAKAGTLSADFYYYAFLQGLKTSVKGTYAFSTSWGSGKSSCTETSPTVSATIVRLTESGKSTLVGATVTGPDNATFAADGVAAGKCYAKTGALQVKSLTWGLYDMRVQGATGSGANLNVCWEGKAWNDYVDPATGNYQTEILVGAGASNPTRALNVPRAISTGACAP